MDEIYFGSRGTEGTLRSLCSLSAKPGKTHESALSTPCAGKQARRATMRLRYYWNLEEDKELTA